MYDVGLYSRRLSIMMCVPHDNPPDIPCHCRNTLQHTATHYSTLQRTATHIRAETAHHDMCYTYVLQTCHVTAASHCNTLQRTATSVRAETAHNDMHDTREISRHPHVTAATHCTTLQRTATHNSGVTAHLDV